jgi:putative Ca2+/H+ antiporter (TMEM165/GDT1 family)
VAGTLPTMTLGVLVAVFPVIFVAELPDKTMFASLILATRGRRLSVWAGATLAFALHVAIAVTIGTAVLAARSSACRCRS